MQASRCFRKCKAECRASGNGRRACRRLPQRNVRGFSCHPVFSRACHAFAHAVYSGEAPCAAPPHAVLRAMLARCSAAARYIRTRAAPVAAPCAVRGVKCCVARALLLRSLMRTRRHELFQQAHVLFFFIGCKNQDTVFMSLLLPSLPACPLPACCLFCHAAIISSACLSVLACLVLLLVFCPMSCLSHVSVMLFFSCPAHAMSQPTCCMPCQKHLQALKRHKNAYIYVERREDSSPAVLLWEGAWYYMQFK